MKCIATGQKYLYLITDPVPDLAYCLGGLNTDEQAAAAMTAFFQSQFSGGYTAPEYIPAPQVKAEAKAEGQELTQEELAEQKVIPGKYVFINRNLNSSRECNENENTKSLGPR